MGLQGAEQHLEKWILCDVDKSLNLSGPQFHDAQNEEIGPDPPGPIQINPVIISSFYSPFLHVAVLLG